MFKQRALTALWFTPLFLGTAWLGNPYFSLLLVPVGLVALAEFYRLAPVAPFLPLGLAWAFVFLISPQFSLSLGLWLTLLVATSFLWLLVFRASFTAWAWTVAGVFYVAWMLSHLLALRLEVGGREWVLFTLLVTFANDTGAYLVGRVVGRHQMAPAISPGKTWEGGIGGILWAVVASLLLSQLFPLSLGYALALLLGVGVGVVAQAGDLGESWLKREKGVKDSGAFLPGHGGLLDRLDSLVFTAPLVYYYFIWM
ncbi:MAG: phosphatidate cytidylyltransferase [Chloroflexota bacterium]